MNFDGGFVGRDNVVGLVRVGLRSEVKMGVEGVGRWWVGLRGRCRWGEGEGEPGPPVPGRSWGIVPCRIGRISSRSRRGIGRCEGRGGGLVGFWVS